MSEIEWRPIPGWEGYYEASNQGDIRSVDRVVDRAGKSLFIQGQALALKTGKNGYLRVALYRDSKPTYSTVHRLVMLTFTGPRPVKHDICHRNGIRNDNRTENLYYGTRSENCLDMRLHGTNRNASKTHCKHGHEFTSENTYFNKGGGRKCKTCTLNRLAVKRSRSGSPDVLDRRWRK